MLDIKDFYIGVLLATPSYYQNLKRFRFVQNISYDPFKDISKTQALIIGIPVLLKYQDGKYFDEYNSRWKNELYYKLGEINELGIFLAHVKPFFECYSDEPVIYIEEEIEEDSELMEEILFTRAYYFAHSKLTNQEALIILNEDIMESAIYEYLRDLLGEEDFNNLCKRNLVKK